jgi:3-hydroxybutyryl-CoA dehydrogenase
MENIAVVGAGLMGHGIAQVFAVAGHSVSIYDPVADVLGRVPARVRDNLQALGLDVSALERIALQSTLPAAAAGADVVFEAALEDLPLKQELFAQLAACTRPDCILASNTSVISIGEIGARVPNPDRVLGTHWWNPPYLIPLVEVVRAPATDPACIERMMELLRRVGKLPVHVKRDVPGFVGNRLQHALWREAISIVSSGICDAETVDLVVKNSFGMRLPVLGPLENADLIGLDLALAVHRYLFPHIENSGSPDPLLEEHVREKNLGMKSGRGFYEWTPESAQRVRQKLTEYLNKVTTRI